MIKHFLFLLIIFPVCSSYAEQTLERLGYKPFSTHIDSQQKSDLEKGELNSFQHSFAIDKQNQQLAILFWSGFNSNPKTYALAQIYSLTTGKLIHEKTFHDMNGIGTSPAGLTFIQNKSLLIDHMTLSEKQYLWEFSHGGRLKRFCGVLETGVAVEFSSDMNVALCLDTAGREVLADLSNGKDIIRLGSDGREVPSPYVINHMTVLRNKKLLYVYGFGLNNNNPEKNHKITQALPDEIELWHLNYFSNADSISFGRELIDRKNKTFTLIEKFKDKTVFTLWDYQNKKLLNKQAIHIPIKSESMTLDGSILLKGHNNDLALVSTSKRRFTLKWHKQFNASLFAKTKYGTSVSKFAFTPNTLMITPNYYTTKANSPLLVAVNLNTGALRSHDNSSVHEVKYANSYVRVLDTEGRYLLFRKLRGEAVYDRVKKKIIDSVDHPVRFMSDDRNVIVSGKRTDLTVWTKK